MKRIQWTVALAFYMFLPACLFAGSKPHPSGLDQRVSELMSKMTIEEKVGQMTQVAIDVVSADSQTVGEYHRLDAQKLRRAIVDYHVGSILNVMGAAYSLPNWHDIITQIQDVAVRQTRLGIPVLYGIDAIHGANYTKGATVFPQSIGMAATWNPELVKKSGAITAVEVRASGIPWNFNPVLGVGRQPLWPRLFETFGEDPYLASVMGVAYVKGLEGDANDVSREDKVAACVKHYIGYSFPFSGKDRTPAYIPERLLRECFLPSFKAAIDAGAHTLMINSSEINGVPVHASHYYLTELLRNELGFQGLAVSDWMDIKNLHRREKVAATEKEAVRMAVMAGVDMSMVPLDFSFYKELVALVKEGSVPESRIDEAVRRILTLKFELGLFANPYPDKSLQGRFASNQSRGVCLQAARESLTLLKNANDTLPLSRGDRILVTGPTANSLSSLNGGWTITWQGNNESLYPKDHATILQALRTKLGQQNIVYEPGTTIDAEVDIAKAVAAAAQADVVVACIGEGAYCELEGNITDLDLPEVQLRLVEALQATGKPVVLVLTEGRPRIIHRIVDHSSAILMAYLPGMEGGVAIADVLAGDFNPCGKLPITYPRYPNDLTLYDRKFSEDENQFKTYNPEFPFGYGLSYTDFEIKNLNVARDTIGLGEQVSVAVTVENTGKIAGKEIVQLYVGDEVASVTPAMKRLKRFAGVFLQPGERKTIRFTLQMNDLSFIGLRNKPVVEPGKFKIYVGNLTDEFYVADKGVSLIENKSMGRN